MAVFLHRLRPDRLVRALQILGRMNAKGEKDGWGDKLRAAEKAREDLYFAKIDEQLLEKIRADEARKKKSASAAPAARDLGQCPRCEEPLRAGLWRELPIEFCPSCRGLWLDQSDLIDLAGGRDLDLHLSERQRSD